MCQVLRWWVAGLVTAGVFAVVTWVAGAFALPVVLASGADRWVVAAGLGVAVAALAALWGHSWAAGGRAGDDGGEPRAGVSGVVAGGDRSVVAGGDVSGIASTGDHAANTQVERER